MEPRRIIGNLLLDNACADWRERIVQSDPVKYRIFNQPVYTQNNL
jgi:hypothetical protein